MGKTLKYVSEFSFPSDKGYSGSAGKTMVKGYARGGSCGYAKGGKMDRLKDVIGNERKEMTRVEAKQRDAGQELSRVRSEMRYDKNEMKGMRKQYPTNRSEPMIAMKKGGHVSKKIMKKNDGGYIEDPAPSGVPRAVSPLMQISNPQAQPALQNMVPSGNTSLSPTAMKKGGHVGKKLVKMANGGALPPGMAPQPSARRLPPQQMGALNQVAQAQQQLQSGGQGGQPLGVAPFGMGRPGGMPQQQNMTQQQMQSMRGQPNVMGSPEMSMQRQLQDAARRQMLESMRDAQGNPLPLQQRIALNEAAQAQQQIQSVRNQPNVMGFPDMPTQQQLQSGGLGRQPLGVAPFGMGRPGGPLNTGGLGQGVASSVNTTTQSDIMGGNRRPMGGFNPGNMMQGLQQFAGRNNPPQIGPNQPMAPQVQRPQVFPPRPPTSMPPPQMGRPAMAKGGKVGKVMGEFKAGELHSGSKSGPVVKSRKQAIAIGLSEARKAKK